MSDDIGQTVWSWPCEHEVSAPSAFEPPEFCPVCKDSRGPKVVDGDNDSELSRAIPIPSRCSECGRKKIHTSRFESYCPEHGDVDITQEANDE